MKMVAKQKQKPELKKMEKKKLVGTRGRTFQGQVIKKFEHRAVIKLVRTVKIPKYERFTKRKTKLHARIPENLDLHIGDTVKVRETRPLSKIVHFLVISVVKEGKR